MTDFVTLFKDKAESLGFDFYYGNKSMLNLLRSELDNTKIYFLMSTCNWKRESSKYGLGRNYVESSFLLVVASDFDNVIYKQKDTNADDGKYIKNVKPMLDKLELFERKMICENGSFERISAIDGYNLMDINTDGLVVTFKYTEA